MSRDKKRFSANAVNRDEALSISGTCPCLCDPFYLRAGERIPTPFRPDGSPNIAFEAEYQKLVAALAKWCRANEVRLLHLAWYGQDWAELNHGKEVRAQPGYSYANWLKAHQRLLDIGLRHAGADLAVEFPFSGHGPLTQAAVDLADYTISSTKAHYSLLR